MAYYAVAVCGSERAGPDVTYGKSWGGYVEKLERILDVEDRTARLVAEARDRAVTMEREAAVEAARVRRQIPADARVSVQAAVAESLARARDEADAMATRAAEDRERLMGAARARIPDAVAAVLSGLVDQSWQ